MGVSDILQPFWEESVAREEVSGFDPEGAGPW